MGSVAQIPSLPSITTDQFGNQFQNGNWVGVVSGSQADLGSKSVFPSTTGPNPQEMTAANILDQAGQMVGMKPNTFSSNSIFTALKKLTLEDYLFMLVGIILIAVGVLAFKTTQTVIQTGTNVARKGAESAAVIAAA